MNEKEIAEIRRRFRPEKNNISRIRGCYVNEKREIVSEIRQSLTLTPQEEAENILAILKRTLSGTVGKNLHDIPFETQQVVDSDEHRLLMALRNSSLEDEQAVGAFFDRVINALTLDENYLILLIYDTYDVPFRSKDGQRQDDASSEVFSYILCSICPIKETKPALSYFPSDNQFHNRAADWVVAAPELGFLFPSFDDRGSNIYSTLYYSRDIAENHPEFVEAVFQREIPMPAAAQKETFQTVLGETLANECSLTVVQAVQEQLCGIIEEHKASHEAEPLVVSKQTVRKVLESCGIAEERLAAFDERYDSDFGEDVALFPKNIVDQKHLALRTPDVTVQVNPQRGDLIETRVINGTKYLLIKVEEGIEVNGVPIHIQ